MSNHQKQQPLEVRQPIKKSSKMSATPGTGTGINSHALSPDQQQLFSDSTGKYTLFSIPGWDTRSEQARWSLDKHNASYIDVDLPWGLHLWTSLKIDPKVANLPILVNQKAEIFSDVTQITMYLYSQAFSGNIRLYSSSEALELQTEFDGKFAKATQTIYLNALLRNPSLAKEFLVDINHLRTWQSISSALWRYTSWIMWFHFGLYQDDTIQKSWDVVHETFSKVEGLLKRKQDGKAQKYLVGNSITAADISFASHSALVLLPPGDKLSLTLPKVEQLGAEYQEQVKNLSSTIAGKFALKLYENDRGEKLAKKLNRDAAINNPVWSQPGYLRGAITNVTMLTIIPLALPFMANLDWNVTVVYWFAIMSIAFWSGYFALLPTLIKRLSQLRKLQTGQTGKKQDDK